MNRLLLLPPTLLALLSGMLLTAAEEVAFDEDGFFDPDAAETPEVSAAPEIPDAPAAEENPVSTAAPPSVEQDAAGTFEDAEKGSRLKIDGSIGTEFRFFFEDPLYPGQLGTFQPSLLLQPELFHETADGKHQFRLAPYLRYDGEDSRRTHFDLREANWRRIGDGWDLLAGIGKVYWGVAESRHLVDAINQVDGVEDIDEEDRLGQPMLNLNLVREWGTLSLFAMTGFRERTFPGSKGRLRSGLPVRDDDPVFESDLEHWYPEFALRYQHSLGGLDLGAHFMHGTGREPTFTLADDESFLRPRYEIVNQAGIDLQYTSGAWLWKLEAIGREGHGSPFFAAVGGLEYTVFQIMESNADLGLLAEYLYDGRDADAPPTAFENDVFAGARLALNDTQDTSLLLGAIVDPSDSTAAILVEAERRLGEHWKLELEARLFTGSTEDSATLRDLADDSFVALRISRHF